MHQMFNEEKNATLTAVSLDLCSSKTRTGNQMVIVNSSFTKRSAFKMYPSPRKRNAGAFKFLWFEERFRKVPLSWWISVDGGRPHPVEITEFSGLLWTPNTVKSVPLSRALKRNDESYGFEITRDRDNRWQVTAKYIQAKGKWVELEEIVESSRFPISR